MPKSVLKILNICNSGKFLNYLEDITGEKGLIPDPYYIGGGIHSTVNNGFLEMHADFNWHEKLNLYRRLNLIIYMNSNWEEEWGGHIKFGIKIKKILILLMKFPRYLIELYFLQQPTLVIMDIRML